MCFLNINSVKFLKKSIDVLLTIISVVLIIQIYAFRAVLIEHEDGSLSKISTDSVTQRENVAKRLLTPLEKNSGGFKGVKYVSFSHIFVENI